MKSPEVVPLKFLVEEGELLSQDQVVGEKGRAFLKEKGYKVIETSILHQNQFQTTFVAFKSNGSRVAARVLFVDRVLEQDKQHLLVDFPREVAVLVDNLQVILDRKRSASSDRD
jgi:hypothetical protein